MGSVPVPSGDRPTRPPPGPRQRGRDTPLRRRTLAGRVSTGGRCSGAEDRCLGSRWQWGQVGRNRDFNRSVYTARDLGRPSTSPYHRGFLVRGDFLGRSVRAKSFVACALHAPPGRLWALQRETSPAADPGESWLFFLNLFFY